MNPKLKALMVAYNTALNHFNFAYTDVEIDAAIYELNATELRITNFLNRASRVITP